MSSVPQLLKIRPDGSMVPLITDLEPSQMIVGMALGGDGFLYMRMSNESEVMRVDPNTGTRTTVATLPSAAFYGGMTRDDQGSLYVTSGKTIYRITPGGLAGVETWADASAVPELEDSSLGAIARDAAGNLYVTAHKNGSLVGRIFKVSPDGLSVTLLAGRGASRTIDGDALTVATFQAPEGIVVTPDGSAVYVSDQHSIRRIKDGMVTTLLGGGRIPNAAAYIDGSGADVRFHNPKGLAWTSDGKLLVADFDNGAIRIVDRF
ncbi:SMP-30/Gluconolaconase/LRE-like region [compost metagenome]